MPSKLPQKIIRWQPHQTRWLNATAKHYGVTIQQVMRWVLDDYMKTHPDGVPREAASTPTPTPKSKKKKEPRRPSTTGG